MTVPFVDSVTGAPIYVNPAYIVTFRPDPGNPTGVTLIKLSDGESLRVNSEHREVADKLGRPS